MKKHIVTIVILLMAIGGGVISISPTANALTCSGGFSYDPSTGGGRNNYYNGCTSQPNGCGNCSCPPECTISYSPSTLTSSGVGSVSLAIIGTDADGQASCSCSGLDSPGYTFGLSAGTYNQGPFGYAGTKSCTCTVSNSRGSNSCSGSLTVTAAPVNGACGSANGGSYSSAPTFGFCSSGTSTGVSGSGPWFWSCKGSGVGSTESCNASILPVLPSCSMSYSPSALTIGTTGNVTLSMSNDADGQASCTCTGLDSQSSAFNLSAGTYTQGPFNSAGTKNCTCTVVSTTGHSGTCSKSLTVNAAAVSGSCGTRNKTYADIATGWGFDTMCGQGSASPSAVSFPSQGTSVSWSCNGSGGGTNASCTATHQTITCTPNCNCAAITCSTQTCLNSCGTAYCTGMNNCTTFSCTDPSTGLSAIPPTGYVMCPNANIGLTQNVSWFITGSGVASCATYNGKCGCYIPPATYSCVDDTGALASAPHLANWCSTDENIGLVGQNFTWLDVTTSECTNRKCEYTMPAYSCTGGNPPYPADWCPNYNVGLTESLDWLKVTSCTNTRKCEYTMPPNECGSANGTKLIDRPSNTCCEVGTPNWIDSDAIDDEWNWQCTGGSGNPVDCSATKKIASPSTSINPNEKTDDKGRLIETRP